MNKEIKFNVGRAENGFTIQQFLAGRLFLSRNAAKALIDQRRVFVNGRRIWMARHRLQAGDIVSGSFHLETKPTITQSVILYEDGDYLIVNKPAGILSNGPNSVEQLLNRQSGNESVACHRLDKDTSGCLIFAKSAEAKEKIIPLFAGNEVLKKYEAVVRGRLPKKIMTIMTPIDGQKAITHVRLLDSTPFASHASGVASHISISIETGKTHQIRKHLAPTGHPVLGDRQYGTGGAAPEIERSIARQMLHAAEISFINPMSGKSIRCQAELPADFKDCLKRFHLK